MPKKSKSNKIDAGFLRFEKAVDVESDPVLMILRAHLLTEYCFDQTIASILPRGDIILEKSFSYWQKLVLLRSFNLLENDHLDLLERLNNLRNKCAHDMEYNISEADIDRIGLPQGKDYLEEKEKFGKHQDKKILLQITIVGIVAPLHGFFDHVKKDHLGVGVPKTPKKKKKL